MSPNTSAREVSNQALRDVETKYRSLFDNMINGFAYHKMVFDDRGEPVDYIFLDVNETFENLTGLNREKVINKKVTEVLPGIENEGMDWIATYGRVAISREALRFENYSEALKRWYSVSAYSPEKGYFATIFEDITDQKQREFLTKTINEIGRIINSTLNFEEIINRVVVEVCKTIGADSAAISLRNRDKWYVASAYGFHQEVVGAEMSDGEEPHAMLAIKTKKIVVITDALTDERVNREHMRRHGVRSVMVIPLVVKGEATGVLFVNRHTAPAEFSKAQIAFAEELGTSLALALENASLLEAERKGKERFQLLSETANRLLATGRPQETVNDLCRRVMVHLDCHAFFNYLVDEQRSCLHLNAYGGIPEETAKEIEWLDYGVAVCDCAARDACRIVAQDILNTPDPRTELVKSFGIKAYACHPLLSAGRVIGTLSFGTRTRTAFTEEDISLMKTVADQVAVAMEKKKLVEALGRSRDELEVRVKERTNELVKANELLERLFSSVDIAVAYMDRDFNFIRVNRAYAKADDREPEFYVGKNHFALFPNEENEKIFREVVDTGEPYSVYARPFEYAQHPERGVTYWDWNLQAVKEPDGRVGGAVLSLVNVTDRVRAQEAVRTERQRLNDVLETLPAYVVLLTPDYHATFANRVFKERFGEAHGRRCFEFLFDRNEPCESCETFNVLKTMAPHEWEWDGPDGRIYSVFDFPFTDTDGSTLILEMGIDVTERKQAETTLRDLNETLEERTGELEKANARLKSANRQLKELNKNLQDFAFIASHDLQEPLRKVRSFGDLLAANYDVSLDETSRDYISRMQTAAARMQNLLNSLLSYSHITTKAEPIRDTDLNKSVEEALFNLEIMIREKSARVEVANLPKVQADRVQMVQLFQNLIGNALKYHRDDEAPHVKVYVRSGKRGRTYDIQVEDNGIGFEEKYLDKIFLPFQRLHGRSSKYEGVGMGLAICKKIAERHGGEISAKSALGKGSTFIVTLPRDREKR